MTCDICREAHGDHDPPCGDCFPGLLPENLPVVQAVSRFAPLLGNGMGGINMHAATHALTECGGDLDDLELLGAYMAWQQEARDDLNGKQTDTP